MALLRIADINEESIVDGPGFRFVIFTQGCPHHCPGCHNPSTHDPAGGQLTDTHFLLEKIKKNPMLQGVTFSGGEPFLQPRVLADFAASIKALGLDIVTYTGFTYEALIAANSPDIARLLEQTDILIDGPYVQEQRKLNLQFRGSTNQRILPLAEERNAAALSAGF